jgi:hypothetical protein
VETFKISNDPAFAEKLEDIVGLYLNPPEHALVLCADEKSQIQALDRPQPGLPLKRGRGAAMPHDYKRNGTATLFAALKRPTAESMASVKNDTDIRNGSSFCVCSTKVCPRISTYISLSTTTRPTNTPPSKNTERPHRCERACFVHDAATVHHHF